MEAGVIEPSGDLYRRKNLITARIITETHRRIQVVNIINYGDEEVQLNESATLGTCESVDANVEITDSTSECGSSVQQCRVFSVGTRGNNVESAEYFAEIPNIIHLPLFLHDLWERNSTMLTSEESHHLAWVLYKYQDVFARAKDDLGRTSLVRHRVNTRNATPHREPPRRR